MNKNNRKYNKGDIHSYEIPKLIRIVPSIGTVDKDGNIHFDLIEVKDLGRTREKINNIKWKIYKFLEWVLEFGKVDSPTVWSDKHRWGMYKPTRMEIISGYYSMLKSRIYWMLHRTPVYKSYTGFEMAVTPMEKPVRYSFNMRSTGKVENGVVTKIHPHSINIVPEERGKVKNEEKINICR